MDSGVAAFIVSRSSTAFDIVTVLTVPATGRQHCHHHGRHHSNDHQHQHDSDD